ncbi:MAG: SOS response-associated peptidase [Pseudomonadota bacterium]
MCGRFNVSSTPGLQELVAALGLSIDLPPPRFNIAPTENVSLLASFSPSQAMKLRHARWWLTPSWSKGPSTRYAMFNARSETLTKSPAFKRPFARQRGIVPMSSFIEWRTSTSEDAKSKQPWLITNDSEALAVAALWDVWNTRGDNDMDPLLSCTLVTTAAAQEFAPWHKRMPVMLRQEDRDRWLHAESIADDDALFSPVLREDLLLTPVDTKVGNSREKHPDLMESVGETVRLRSEKK